MQLLVSLELLVVYIEVQAEQEPCEKCCCAYVYPIILQDGKKAYCSEEFEQEEAQLRVKKHLCESVPLMLVLMLELEIGQDRCVLHPEYQSSKKEQLMDEQSANDAHC